MSFERYAIYWAPRPDSALAAFARSWLGGDAETGGQVDSREHFGLDAGLVEQATASPRRYGIHATLKAPFRLREEASVAELADSMAAFCAKRRPARSGNLRLQRFSRYLALVPGSGLAELEWLAAECVTHFDAFRASLNENDRAHRSGAMPPLAAAHFEQFGYPDIFERFMFHITLSGPLEAHELDAVEAALAPAVAPFMETAFTAEDLCLCGDPGQGGLFRILRRAPFMR